MRVRYEDNYGQTQEQDVVVLFPYNNYMYAVIKEPHDERHPFRVLYIENSVKGAQKNTTILLGSTVD